jgi:hypothetical protein
MPRFILFLRASSESESPSPPSDPSLFAAMAAFNASLEHAGVLRSGEGLLPSARDSVRVAFHDSGPPTMTPGPFPVSEIVCGWWVLETKDVEEAVGWAKRVPKMEEGAVVEVRRIAGVDDLGEAFSEEMKREEEEMRKRLEGGGKREGT